MIDSRVLIKRSFGAIPQTVEGLPPVNYGKTIRLKNYDRLPPVRLPPVYESGNTGVVSGNVPTISGALISPNLIQLKWSPVPGAVGYKLRRNGVVYDRGNITTDYVQNPSAGINYFEVAAYDVSGKVGEYSNVLPLTISGGTVDSTGTVDPRYGSGGGVPVADDMILGFPSTYVLIGGAAAVVGLLVLFGGKK